MDDNTVKYLQCMAGITKQARGTPAPQNTKKKCLFCDGTYSAHLPQHMQKNPPQSLIG